MPTNKGTTITGYVFPNIPNEWSPEEKRFALALRGLFDTLFQKTRGLKTDYDKDDYSKLKNKPSISGTVLNGNKSLSDIGIHDVNSTDSGLMTVALYEKLTGITDVSEDGPGLMTVALFTKLNGIEDGATATSECRPEVDYLSMMTEIDIPTDFSDKVEKVAGYYEDEVWNLTMVWDAVGKWITAEEYEEITGETYDPNDRPDPEEPEPDEPDEPEEPEEPDPEEENE